MLRLGVVCALLALSLAQDDSGVDLSCAAIEGDMPTNTNSYMIRTGGVAGYLPGSHVNVTLAAGRDQQFKAVLVQAKLVGGNYSPMGSWIFHGMETVEMLDCNGDSHPDTVYLEEQGGPYSTLHLVWHAPDTASNAKMEINAIFYDMDLAQKRQRSIILPELSAEDMLSTPTAHHATPSRPMPPSTSTLRPMTPSTNTARPTVGHDDREEGEMEEEGDVLSDFDPDFNPELERDLAAEESEDPREEVRRVEEEMEDTLRRDMEGPIEEAAHNPRTEDELSAQMEEKIQREIDLENLASEDGYNHGRWEEEQRHLEEIHQEEVAYERLIYEEEQARLARIRAEIRDKEE